MRKTTLLGLSVSAVLGCNGSLDEVEEPAASSSSSTSSATSTTNPSNDSTSGGPILDAGGGGTTGTTGVPSNSTGPATTADSGSTSLGVTGSTGGPSTGSTGDISTGSTGDISTGSTGDISTGSTGSTGGPTCDDLFGTAPGYILCIETETECHFNATTAGGNCDEMCGMFMAMCLEAFDNPNIAGMECDIIEPNMDDCTTNRGTEICVCAK